MSLDLSFSKSDEMVKEAALDFMRRSAPKSVIEDLQETDTGCTEEILRHVVEMGWFGMSSETPEEGKQYEMSFYDNFIKDLPEDAFLCVVDCHI